MRLPQPPSWAPARWPRAPSWARTRWERARSWARADPTRAALAGLLLVGLALRIYFLLVWSPAITGYSDTGIYFQDSVEPLWTDPIRTVGYSMLLRLLHWVSPHLVLVILVQHVLGLGTALLLFLTVRRCGGPRWLGLAPAAIVALGGDQLFLEHAALSDAVFTFLIAAMLYCAVRAAPHGGSAGAAGAAGRGSLRWGALAGLLAGLGVWDRGAGVSLIPVIAVWLVFCPGRPTRRTLALGALALVVSLATVGVYIEWRQTASGLSGLTTNGNWNLYGRVAPWADCRKFAPPGGTEQLCETTPPAQRGWRSSEYYIYGPQSPAQALIGPPYEISPDRFAMQRLLEWSESALTAQPLAYLHAVGLDTIRLISPNAHSYGDLSADALIAFMLGGPDRHSGINRFVSYWQKLLYPGDSAVQRGDIAPLKRWEKLTRITGVWMAGLLLLCLASPWLLPRGTRAGAMLLVTFSLVLVFFPIFTKSYDYRFLIPAFGPLFAAGALALWGFSRRVGARRGAASA